MTIDDLKALSESDFNVWIEAARKTPKNAPDWRGIIIRGGITVGDVLSAMTARRSRPAGHVRLSGGAYGARLMLDRAAGDSVTWHYLENRR